MADNQITCMAGEFLTAGKLFKRGLQASLTLGNAKAIDILAYNSKNRKNYNVQVKTSREKNNFRYLNGNEIEGEHIFIFIVLNDFTDNEDFFVVKGSEILENAHTFFGSTFNNENLPENGSVSLKALSDYKDNWGLFDI